MLRTLFIGELTGLLITRLFFNSCTGMVLLSIVLLKFLLRSRFSLLFLDDAEEVHIPVGRNIGQGVGAAPFGFCLVAQPISTVTIARVSIFLMLNFLTTAILFQDQVIRVSDPQKMIRTHGLCRRVKRQQI